MNLRQQAAADLKGIIEDTATGFAINFTLTSPYGKKAQLQGLYRDIAVMVGPAPDQLVSLRQSVIAMATATVLSIFKELPKGVQDGSGPPWIVDLVDFQGVAQSYTIIDDVPDELGIVYYTLEVFQRYPDDQ